MLFPTLCFLVIFAPRDCLTGIKGRFVPSLNDVRPIRDLFKDLTVESVPLTYGINNNELN